MRYVLKLKNNRLNDRDFNIDQNNPDYDIFHNQAALAEGEGKQRLPVQISHHEVLEV